MDTYRHRDQIIASLGFASYRDYLRSPLWFSIRRRCLVAAEWQCCVCRTRKTLQVHHAEYTEANLSGRHLTGMVVICEHHHRQAEFEKKRKVSQVDANARIRGAIRKLAPRREDIYCQLCRVNRRQDGGPCPFCKARVARDSERAKVLGAPIWSMTAVDVANLVKSREGRRRAYAAIHEDQLTATNAKRIFEAFVDAETAAGDNP